MEDLLTNTTISVNLLGGTLDGVAPVTGNEAWVEELQWPGADDFDTAQRKYIDPDGVIEGFYKTSGRLSFYTVYRSGHTVPAHNPRAVDFILKRIAKF